MQALVYTNTQTLVYREEKNPKENAKREEKLVEDKFYKYCKI